MKPDYSFTLPSADLEKDVRITQTLQTIKTWILSDDLIALLDIFGFGSSSRLSVSDDDQSFFTYLSEVVSFVDENWDFRKGSERWDIQDTLDDASHTSAIKRVVCSLGMNTETSLDRFSTEKIDYILPLGGARLSNFTRTERAHELSRIHPEASVCALSAKRPLSEIEFPFVEKYAKHPMSEICTEFDAINEALEVVFGCLDYNEQAEAGLGESDTERQNASHCLRSYKTETPRVFSLSAPSSVPTARRANTLDTLKHFQNTFQVASGSTLAAITTSIYVPFQTLILAPFAIENELNLYLVGSIHSSLDDASRRDPSAAAYLQEIKAAVDACHIFCKKYAPI